MHFRFQAIRLFALTALALTASIAITGCGKKENAAATQVVAKVDGAEISVHQMNSVLSKATGITPENLANAKREVLERLVEQQIAINEATSLKLDRTPEVVSAIENAKREIIARAVLEQIAMGQPKPTDEEAKKYFTDHPELFAQRRLFNLQEIALAKTNKDIAEIRGLMTVAKSMDDVSVWLKSRNIDFTVNGGTRAAEQIPLDVLPALSQFKDGQLGLIEGKDAFYIMRVIASRLAPVDEAQAMQKIRVFLFNQRGAEVVKQAKLSLREKAKVEYLGEFAGGEKAFKEKAQAEAKATSEALAKTQEKNKVDAEAFAKLKSDEKSAAQTEALAQSKARADARSQSSKDQKPADPLANINLEKGMKGLK